MSNIKPDDSILPPFFNRIVRNYSDPTVASEFMYLRDMSRLNPTYRHLEDIDLKYCITQNEIFAIISGNLTLSISSQPGTWTFQSISSCAVEHPVQFEYSHTPLYRTHNSAYNEKDFFVPWMSFSSFHILARSPPITEKKNSVPWDPLQWGSTVFDRFVPLNL